MQIEKYLMLLVACLLPISSVSAIKNPAYHQKVIEVANKNIRNAKTHRFVPKEVLIDPKGSVIVTPVQDPFVKVFDPESPMADKLGMIYLPRISVEEEKAKIKKARLNLGR